jgi:hypothetical protein
MPPLAPIQLSEREDISQRTQETFRGPEFGEELARSRSLSERFPEQIMDFLSPLLIPQRRATDRGRENLIDTFRRTGGLKSSSAGQRFTEFERDASLNEMLALTKGAQSFFAPLAALQQNRLAVSGAPLSRSQATGKGTGATFGFTPTDQMALQELRGEQALDLLGQGQQYSQQQQQTAANADRGQDTRDWLRGVGKYAPQPTAPQPFAPAPAPAPAAPAAPSLAPPSYGGGGGGGGGGVYFDPATGMAQSTSQAGFSIAGQGLQPGYTQDPNNPQISYSPWV